MIVMQQSVYPGHRTNTPGAVGLTVTVPVDTDCLLTLPDGERLLSGESFTALVPYEA